MDDRRFDSLVKSLASGASRRKVLKGLLGLGGAAAVGGTLLEGPAEAARRPTPTPKPVKCPGVQTWNSTLGKCVCPANLSQCVPGVGPTCCNDKVVAEGSPGYSECCDNACCQGTCYGEELCCATNSRPGEQPPTNRICDTRSGPECCLYSDKCCIVDGCCATVCYGGSVGADSCCPVEDFCPGGSESDGLCCTGNTTCCGRGTNANACVDLTVPGNCCNEGDCGDPCKICNENHICADRCDPQTQVCCTEQAGPGVCVNGECCPGAPCGEAQVCCDTGEGTVCCPGGYTCVNNQCTPPCEASVQIFVQTHGPLQVPGVCPGPFANVATEVGLYPYANGQCSGTAIATASSSANGPAVFSNIPGGQYCALPTDGTIAGCLDCPDYGQGVGVNLTVPCSGTFQWTIGVDNCCIDDGFHCGEGCCPQADTCCEGQCCTGECLRHSEAPDVCCTTLACLEGEARECCPNVEDYKCCGTAGCCEGQCTGEGGNECCTSGLQCPLADESSECCPNSNEYKCCGVEGCCTSSRCNEEADVCCPEDRFACGLVEGNECCDTATQKCCDGLCIPASECCPSTDGNCCVPLTCADAPQYSCPREFADGCGGTLNCSGNCPAPQFCNDSGWCDCELGQECAVDDDCCSMNCCNGTCVANGDPCCAELCAIGDRCGTVDGCECTCREGMFCMPNSTFCCPGTGLGTNDNCRWCGDACGAGTICQPGNGGYECACINNGDGCADDSHCCSGLCQAGVCVICKDNGFACAEDGDCCSGDCVVGTCQMP